MFHYLLLCLLAASLIPPGQTQTTVRTCNNCRLKVYSMCFLTTAYTTQCEADSSCGSVRYSIGSESIFTTTGCVTTSECNRTAQLSGVMKLFNYNATCCISDNCNGGFVIQAPYITILTLLGISVFYFIL